MWVRWALLAFAVLNLFYALRALYLLRRAGAGERTGHALDVADHVLGAVMMATLSAGADHPAVVFGALTLLGPVMLWKIIRETRARQAAKARTAPEDGQAPAEAG